MVYKSKTKPNPHYNYFKKQSKNQNKTNKQNTQVGKAP